MLVLERETVGAEHLAAVIRRLRVLELGDHRLAAAGVARHRVAQRPANRRGSSPRAPAAARWRGSPSNSIRDWSPASPGAARRAAFGSSSGKPNTQPSATRCAVEGSITLTLGLAISETASRAASSGRHRITTSALLSASARAEASLRRASSKHDQLELAARRKTLADFEPRRARRAVDEDLRDHGRNGRSAVSLTCPAQRSNCLNLRERQAIRVRPAGESGDGFRPQQSNPVFPGRS